MNKRLETVEKDATLADASKIMKEKGIRHLLIVDKATGILQGIISDRDLKKMVSPFIGSTRETPQDVATTTIEVGRVMVPKDKLLTAKPEDDVRIAVEKMLSRKLGAIPIVDPAGIAVGIITRGDIL